MPDPLQPEDSAPSFVRPSAAKSRLVQVHPACAHPTSNSKVQRGFHRGHRKRQGPFVRPSVRPFVFFSFFQTGSGKTRESLSAVGSGAHPAQVRVVRGHFEGSVAVGVGLSLARAVAAGEFKVNNGASDAEEGKKKKEGASCDATRKFVDFHSIHPSVRPSVRPSLPYLATVRRRRRQNLFCRRSGVYDGHRATDATRRQETSIRFLGSLFVSISGVALREA